MYDFPNIEGACFCSSFFCSGYTGLSARFFCTFSILKICFTLNSGYCYNDWTILFDVSAVVLEVTGIDHFSFSFKLWSRDWLIVEVDPAPHSYRTFSKLLALYFSSLLSSTLRYSLQFSSIKKSANRGSRFRSLTSSPYFLSFTYESFYFELSLGIKMSWS